MKENKTIAYVGGANLHQGVKSLDWNLDYARFRIWLTEKYNVDIAYLFIGLIPKYKDLYTYLQKAGFTLVFKEVVYDGNGKAKGNCDADLIVQAMKDSYEEKTVKSILVSSDGDYTQLVKFWQNRGQIQVILSPAPPKKCSILLKRTEIKIVYLDDKKNVLGYKNEKTPDGDEHRKGPFRSEH
ncbi:MAG: NYN domain-containing protein [Patescibacteria group bacterium]